MSETELDWLRLHLTPGLGRKGIFRLIEHFSTPRAALEHAPAGWQGMTGLRRAGLVPASTDRQFLAARRQIEQSQARLVSYWDEAYPLLLRDIPDQHRERHAQRARNAACAAHQVVDRPPAADAARGVDGHVAPLRQRKPSPSSAPAMLRRPAGI